MSVSREFRPVAFEALAVPPDHSVWFDDHEYVRPPFPSGSQRDPEGAVHVVEGGARPDLLEGSYLLAKRQVLKHKFSSRSEEGTDESDHDCDEKHDRAQHCDRVWLATRVASRLRATMRCRRKSFGINGNE